MRNKQTTIRERNWFLVVIASLLIIIGSVLVVVSVMNIGSFGWWSLLIGLSGLTTIVPAIMSIVKNDPSWILLDLIIPG